MSRWSMWPSGSQQHRAGWLRGCGLCIGHDSTVRPARPGRRSSIGAPSYLGVGCVFQGRAAVVIGSPVALAHQVVVTSTHDRGGPWERAGDTPGHAGTCRVTVGDGCWVGARATLLPGVRIGEGCVIAGGAVVTLDCRPHGLYAGVPATRVRDLESAASPSR